MTDTGATSDQGAPMFHGLDLCDGCGSRLAPRECLAGLCSACSKSPKRSKPHERKADQ